jgi:hypothetical protein
MIAIVVAVVFIFAMFGYQLGSEYTLYAKIPVTEAIY